MHFTHAHLIRLICSFLALFLSLDLSFSWPSQADWKAEWERTVEAARKEGQVTIIY